MAEDENAITIRSVTDQIADIIMAIYGNNKKGKKRVIEYIIRGICRRLCQKGMTSEELMQIASITMNEAAKELHEEVAAAEAAQTAEEQRQNAATDQAFVAELQGEPYDRSALGE